MARRKSPKRDPKTGRFLPNKARKRDPKTGQYLPNPADVLVLNSPTVPPMRPPNPRRKLPARDPKTGRFVKKGRRSNPDGEWFVQTGVDLAGVGVGALVAGNVGSILDEWLAAMSPRMRGVVYAGGAAVTLGAGRYFGEMAEALPVYPAAIAIAAIALERALDEFGLIRAPAVVDEEEEEEEEAADGAFVETEDFRGAFVETNQQMAGRMVEGWSPDELGASCVFPLYQEDRCEQLYTQFPGCAPMGDYSGGYTGGRRIS